MNIYEELLAEIGICQTLTDTAANNPRKASTNYPVCCTGDTNDIIVLDGSHICWQCGNTVDFSVYVFYNPYPVSGRPIGGSNTITIERKRGYKSLTHFKEHLRRYMGARFGEYPKDLLDKLRDKVDVHRPDCYRNIQRILREIGHKTMYKEIFAIIYLLGGRKPYIDNHLFAYCVTDFMWIQERFRQLKNVGGTGRKNMPSMYVIMDILLKRHGHTPFYVLPYLKDENLQANVMRMFDELDGNDKLGGDS